MRLNCDCLFFFGDFEKDRFKVIARQACFLLKLIEVAECDDIAVADNCDSVTESSATERVWVVRKTVLPSSASLRK